MPSPMVRALASGQCLLITLLFLAVPAPAAAVFKAGVHEDVILLGTQYGGVPLSGYGGGDRRLFPPDWLNLFPWAHYLKPSNPADAEDRIRARALWLEDGSEKLVFVSLDMIAVWRELYEGVRQELSDRGHALEPGALMMSATHTHNGPGAMMESDFAEIIAADRYEQELYDLLKARVADIVLGAKNKAAAAATSELYCAGFETMGIQKNRNDRPGHFDKHVNVLLVWNGSSWSGAMINYAVHGTAHSESDLELSGDLPAELGDQFGVLLAEINNIAGQQRVPVLFINGAEGDVAPSSSDISGLASNFKQQAKGALEAGLQNPMQLHKLTPTWSVDSQEISLGTAMQYFSPYQFKFPPARLLKGLGLDISPWMTNQTEIFSILLDDVRFMTWPGEATTSLGYALRNLGKHNGACQTWVMGLTNDHKAYFTTPEEFDTGGYEAANSYFGPHAGDLIVKEHCELLE